MLGFEGAGVVEAVGDGVSDVKVGRRVAYAAPPMGAYAEERFMPADVLVPLPEAIDDRTGAAMMLKGMTVEYLQRRCFEVKPGHTILVHAATGGGGVIACQWARHLGAKVIGTVGSEEKAKLARANGCDHPIDYGREDVAARVREITGGAGVAVVYDGVGAATFQASLDILAPRGLLVLFGQPSGPVPPLALGTLTERGSLYLTRPTLMTYIERRDEMLAGARALFDVVAQGAVKIAARQTYALKDVAQAHRDIEGRKTSGSTVLLP